MKGVRSIHAPEIQNLATLSKPKDRTASGGLPPLMAARILSSVSPPTLLTVIHGYSAWKPSKIWLKVFSSRLEVHSLHIVRVTGAWDSLGLIVGGAEGDAVVPPPAVHATANTSRLTATTSVLNRRLMTYPLL